VALTVGVDGHEAKLSGATARAVRRRLDVQAHHAHQPAALVGAEVNGIEFVVLGDVDAGIRDAGAEDSQSKIVRTGGIDVADHHVSHHRQSTPAKPMAWPGPPSSCRQSWRGHARQPRQR
jgi:hypothetical protein